MHDRTRREHRAPAPPRSQCHLSGPIRTHRLCFCDWIVNAEAYVVEAFAIAIKKSSKRAGRLPWFDQLEVAIATIQICEFDWWHVDRVYKGDRQTEDVPEP